MRGGVQTWQGSRPVPWMEREEGGYTGVCVCVFVYVSLCMCVYVWGGGPSLRSANRPGHP